MNQPNLYDILGVKRDAKPRDIKYAYRKRAAAPHPDKGGTDEALQAINLAWEVLGDPEKRKRYDETGEVAGAEPRTSPGEGLFLHIIDELIRESVEKGSTRSIVHQAGTRLKDTIWRGENHLAKLRANVERLESQFGRYVSRISPENLEPYDRENLVESRLRAAIDRTRGEIAQTEVEVKAYAEALVVCRRYEDARPAREVEVPVPDFEALLGLGRTKSSRAFLRDEPGQKA